MSRILVTGGAGFIGSHTVDLLLARGEEVRVLDNLQPRVHPRGRPDWLDRRADLVRGDVTSAEDLRAALDGIDRVLHLAAYQDYQPDFHRFLRVNAESTALLFELVVRDRLPVAKIVIASSQSVAGEGVYHCGEHGLVLPGPRPASRLDAGLWDVVCPTCGAPMSPELIDESVCRPHTAYAISKHAAEELCAALGQRYGIPTACMRYTYVQGPRNSPFNAYSGIARRFALALLSGRPPVCYEDGQQLRDFVNVRDVARANVTVLDDERVVGIFNVGGGRAVTVLDFASLLVGVCESPLSPVVPGRYRLGDTRHTVSDISRMAALGWRPTVPVEESMHEYVSWLREQAVAGDWLGEADAAMAAAGVVRDTGSR